MTMQIDIVSAEGHLHSGAAKFVVAPAVDGEIGIAPRHAPFLTKLKHGTVRVTATDGDVQAFYVAGGILEVQAHSVTVLADTAVRAADLDEALILESKRKAEEILANRKADLDLSAAQAQLIEAAAQLRALEQLRKISKR